jgi:hypothetical protein
VSRKNIGFSPRHEGVAIYDDGVRRANTTPGHTGSNVIEFSDSASRLYGYNNETTDFGFRRMLVDSSGVTTIDSTSNLISGFGVDIEYNGGRIYTTTGRVIDPEARTLLGTYPASGPLEADSSVGRTFFISSSGGSARISAFDQQTFTLVGVLDINGVSGGPLNLVRWGPNGLAFSTTGGQVYLVQTFLVAGGPPSTTPSSTLAASPTPTPTPTTPATGIHDAGISRIGGPSSVRLRPGVPDSGRVTVVAANRGDHADMVGVYVAFLPPGGTQNFGGCSPSEVSNLGALNLLPGGRLTVKADPAWQCADPAAMDGVAWTIKAIADVHADDFASCSTLEQIFSGECSAALADDDNSGADNTVLRARPRVVALAP